MLVSRAWAALCQIGFVVALPATATATEPDGPTWMMRIGGSLEYGPDYPGARSRGFTPVLSDLEFYRTDDGPTFGAPDDSYELPLFDNGWLNLGPVGDYQPGRSAGDDARLSGLDNYPATFVAGLYAEAWPVADRLRGRIELLQGLRSGAGLQASFFADWVEQHGPWTFSGGPRAVWGNAAFMRDRFGISPAAEANSGLPAHDVDAGFSSVGMTLAVSYALSPRWTVTLYDAYGRLVGDAADSPIVQTIGSKDQNILGMSLEFTFDTGF